MVVAAANKGIEGRLSLLSEGLADQLGARGGQQTWLPISTGRNPKMKQTGRSKINLLQLWSNMLRPENRLSKLLQAEQNDFRPVCSIFGHPPLLLWSY